MNGENYIIDDTRGAIIGFSLIIIWAMFWLFVSFLFDKYNDQKNNAETELISENKNL